TKERLEQLGVAVVGSTPEGLAAHLKAEMDKWGPVIRDAGIKIDGGRMIARYACLVVAAAVLALLPASAPTSPQNYPHRFVRLVVPFPPGGGTDAIARVVAGRLSEMWGQQVVIENKGGAATNIGTEAVARAEPDGYTLLLQSMPMAVNRFLFPS